MTDASNKARPLGQLSLIALGLNGVVGVGIFFVPSSVAKHLPGWSGALAYAATAAACLPVALAFSRLAPRFDEDGGPYVYARAAFGPAAAFAMGWLTYVSALFSTAAVIRGLAEALTRGMPHDAGVLDPARLVASATVIALVALSAAGLRVAAWTWTGITIAKLVPLIALLGAWAFLAAPEAVPAAVTVTESAPLGLSHVARAAMLVLFTLQGFEVVPVPAGHVRNPRAMSIATVVVLGIAAALYVALHLACVRFLPQLAASQSPLVDVGRAIGGPSFARLIVAGTSVSALGISFGMVAMTPRYLSTLGRPDGLGSSLGRTNARGVPMRALVFTGLAVLVFVQAGSLDELFALSSIAVLAQYGSTAASLVKLGASRQFGLGRGDVALGVLALAAAASVAVGASFGEVLRASAIVAVGIVVRALVMRRRS